MNKHIYDKDGNYIGEIRDEKKEIPGTPIYQHEKEDKKTIIWWVVILFILGIYGMLRTSNGIVSKSEQKINGIIVLILFFSIMIYYQKKKKDRKNNK